MQYPGRDIRALQPTDLQIDLALCTYPLYLDMARLPNEINGCDWRCLLYQPTDKKIIELFSCTLS